MATVDVVDSSVQMKSSLVGGEGFQLLGVVALLVVSLHLVVVDGEM